MLLLIYNEFKGLMQYLTIYTNIRLVYVSVYVSTDPFNKTNKIGTIIWPFYDKLQTFFKQPFAWIMLLYLNKVNRKSCGK